LSIIFRKNRNDCPNTISFSCPYFIGLVSCKKQLSDPSDGTYRIVLSQGDGQSDTTGNTLKTPFLFKVTKGGDTITCGYVRFETYNCDNDLQTVEAGSIAVSDGIYVSKDHAQSWTKVYTVNPNPGFDNTLSAITKQANTYYFYSSSENILMKTTDFAQYNIVTPPVGGNYGREFYQYIVTHENNIILSTQFYGIYYYIPLDVSTTAIFTIPKNELAQ
jgi:hypothetical protein